MYEFINGIYNMDRKWLFTFIRLFKLLGRRRCRSFNLCYVFLFNWNLVDRYWSILSRSPTLFDFSFFIFLFKFILFYLIIFYFFNFSNLFYFILFYFISIFIYVIYFILFIIILFYFIFT